MAVADLGRSLFRFAGPEQKPRRRVSALLRSFRCRRVARDAARCRFSRERLRSTSLLPLGGSDSAASRALTIAPVVESCGTGACSAPRRTRLSKHRVASALAAASRLAEHQSWSPVVTTTRSWPRPASATLHGCSRRALPTRRLLIVETGCAVACRRDGRIRRLNGSAGLLTLDAPLPVAKPGGLYGTPTLREPPGSALVQAKGPAGGSAPGRRMAESQPSLQTVS